MDLGIIGFTYGAISSLEGVDNPLEDPISTGLNIGLGGSISTLAVVGISTLIPKEYHKVFGSFIVFSTGYRLYKIIKDRKNRK